MNPYGPNTATFLSTIWSHSEGAHVFTPRQVDGGWREGRAQIWREAVNEVPLNLEDPGDFYFTPLKFHGDRRRIAHVGRPGVIYADLDAPVVGPLKGIPSPSIIVESGTENHYHWYWLLDEPVSVEEWVPYAKGVTQAIPQADPGGWDLTQVLRVPGSLNYKRHPASPVEVIFFNPRLVYTLDHFKVDPSHKSGGLSSLMTTEDLPVPLSTPELATWWAYFGKEASADLKDLIKNPRQVKDRSRVIWKAICEMRDAGLSPGVAYHLALRLPWQKYAGNEVSLWRQVQKAYNSTA